MPAINGFPDRAQIREWIARALPVISTLTNQGIDIVGSFVVSIVLARYLGAEALGQFGFSFGVAALLSIFVLCGTDDVATKHYVRGDIDEREVLGATLSLCGAGSAIAVVFAVVIALVMDLSRVEYMTLGAAMTVLLLNGTGSMLRQLIVARDWSPMDVPGAVFSRIVLIIGVIFAGLEGSMMGVLVAHIVSASLHLLSRVWLLSRKGVGLPRVRMETIRRMWGASKRVGIGTIFGTISSRADVLLLRGMSTPLQLSYYVAAYRVINGISSASVSAAIALFPAYLSSAGGREPSPGARLFRAIPWIAAAVLIPGAVWLTAPLVQLLYGDEFAESARVMSILFVAACFLIGNTFLSKVLIAREAEDRLPLAQAVGAVMNVGMNAVLIPQYGAAGAAAATVMSEVATFTMLAIGVRAVSRKANAVEGRATPKS